LLKPSEHMLLALKNVHELSPTLMPVFRKSSARLPAKNCGRDSAGCFEVDNFKGRRSILQDSTVSVALQDAQRQTVIPTEFSRPQSARFEFNHQSLDLFKTSSLPLSNLPVCRHSHSAPKKPADEQLGLVRRLRLRRRGLFGLLQHRQPRATT
jgi:hypothetical protein